MGNGQHTKEEINSQADVWRTALSTFAQQQAEIATAVEGAVDQYFLVTGCGSTYYLSLSVAALLNELKINARAVPASELVYFPELLPQQDVWLLALSRSGTTTETIWAVERFRERYPAGKVIAITTIPESDLAERSDILLAAPSAQEKSVAQTRSFTAMLLLAQALASTMAGRRHPFDRMRALPDTLWSLLERANGLPLRLGQDLSLDRFFFLGAGALYGLASEAMLKTKEMTRSWAEAYHPLEFRHGPMSVVNDETLVVGLLSDNAVTAEVQVLKDMKALGARVLVLTEDSSRVEWSGMDDLLELRSGLDLWERSALYLPVVQWFAYYRALAKGLDPDHPTNLAAVVKL